MAEVPPFAPIELTAGDGLRVLVRPLRPADMEAWVEHTRGDLAHLGEHLSWPERTCDPGRALQFITRYAEREGGRVVLLGSLLGERLVGGSVLMDHDPSTGSVELGCWAVSEIEGQGLTRRLCVETLRYAREALKAHRVQWKAASANRRSLALAGRLGFVYEGRLREAAVHHGRRQDLDVLSLVGAEIDREL